MLVNEKRGALSRPCSGCTCCSKPSRATLSSLSRRPGGWCRHVHVGSSQCLAPLSLACLRAAPHDAREPRDEEDDAGRADGAWLWALGYRLWVVLHIDLVVSSEAEGQRLDRFLVSVLAEYSRSQIQKLIADGHVTVRRRPARTVDARPNLSVHEGDEVVVDAPEAAASTAAAEALPLESCIRRRRRGLNKRRVGASSAVRIGHSGECVLHMARLRGIA